MTDDGKKRETGEAKGATRRRSIAIALMLGLMVALFYAATIVRLGGNVMNKGGAASPAAETEPAEPKKE